MADEDVKQEENDAQQEKTDGAKTSKLPWILLGIIVPICAGGGFFMGKILAGNNDVPQEVNSPTEDKKPDYMKILNDKASEENTWIYAVEPLVANLNDVGARRYLRVGFNLEMNGQFEEVAGAVLLDGKKHLINNWLGLYLSDKNVTDLQGERNLRTILAQVKSGLNEVLFPDVKPLIVNVLFSERAIQ